MSSNNMQDGVCKTRRICNQYGNHIMIIVPIPIDLALIPYNSLIQKINRSINRSFNIYDALQSIYIKKNIIITLIL